MVPTIRSFRRPVAGFEQEMRDAGVDWQLVAYGGAVHNFTGLEYDRCDEGAQYNEGGPSLVGRR